VATADLDLLQGTLDLLILKTLTWGPMHGYAVARWIADTTADDLQIEEGALYTALHRMEKRGLLEAEWGLSENNRKAKFYQLTALGRKQLRDRSAVWTRYATAVFKVLQTQTA
jgi:transcriptional regulator